MKKISAKILITQLVILCITLFIFPTKVKAEDVDYPFFLYNVRHTYEEDSTLVHPFRHKYEFYIHANHEVTGRFIISVTTGSNTTSHTWFCESGGEIYNNQIMDRSTGTTVLVTGQQYLKVTLMYMSDSPIDVMNVRSIIFSQTDLDGNQITTDQSLWSEVQKIEDHTFQILSSVGFVNDNLTDVRSKLQSVITLMNTTNQSLSTLVTTATNILTKVTSIDTAIQNIDTTLDTISWQDSSSNTQFLGYSTDGKNITTLTYPYTINTSNPAYVHISGYNTPNAYLYKFQLPISYGSLSHMFDDFKIEFYQLYNNQLYELTNVKYYQIVTRQRVEIYLYDYESINNRNLVIKLTPTTNAYIYSDTYYSYRLGNNDIEYWKLISYFNQYNFYKQQKEDNKTIIDKLSELILGNSTTNNSVNENDQTNNEFKQQAEQYDQIESTFQSSFSTDQQAIQNEIEVNTLTSFASTAVWFVTKLNYLFDASGEMKILFTMPLLLGLALFFIGRGAKTTSPNTIDSFYSQEMTANNDGVKFYHVRRTSNAHKVFHGFNRKK